MPKLQKNNFRDNAPLKVLIAPLDWGLGHATRCVLIINRLLEAGYEVIIASDGPQAQVLQKEFPTLRMVKLPGYNLTLGKGRRTTIFKICLQIPKILTEIKKENSWLKNFLCTEKLDLIISDNRYGLYSKQIYSVFITHQLYIKTAFGKWIEKKLQALNYRFINRFSICWVADNKKNQALAGILSHPAIFPKKPIQYIGNLSRFIKTESLPTYTLMVLLSGPEPQRTLLENKLIAELKDYPYKTIFIRGLPAEKKTLFISPSVETYNHLSSVALNEKIAKSEWVICRSGYTTMMDLARMGKKSILIPTPGQTEQEYLADYLSEKKFALKINQEDFSLKEIFEAAMKFPFEKFPEQNQDLLGTAIKNLSTAIQTEKL
ncbi:MAG: glycosyl transferase family 28 [Bacteroidetes bacterium]|nr:glycosyl transferase family 28 [Bacteroidota bacterium]